MPAIIYPPSKVPLYRQLITGLVSTLLLALMLALMAIQAAAETSVAWPQQVETEQGVIVVYQPQPESLSGNTLTGRAAMSLEMKDKPEPIFGMFWFSAKIDTDHNSDTALVRNFKVTRVRWPDSRDAEEQRFTSLVESAMPKAGFNISLSRLSASLENAEIEQHSLGQLKNDPPVILFKNHLAVLLSYDGEPRFKPVDNSHYERALNTPLLVTRDTRNQTCYLSSGSLWYQASNPMGPWSVTSKPPADLVALLPEPEGDSSPAGQAPEIIVATKPTELVASQGKPQWSSLSDGQVLYVTNTETPWLRDLPTGNMYILLSGRWYRAKNTAGPWTFVPADELPKGFADIPPASDIGGLRTSVAGTPEAEEAVLDAQIPQTAAIVRSEATLQVQYDGKPKFEKIPGTNVSQAVNTGAQVLKIDQKYYAVDNGVWFVSDAAEGPWVVADSIPQEEIAQIPPSSSAYNTTYVQIYESTPEIVYVGYTPGYMWSFRHYGVPVYGTGWYYPPYWGRYYYPRPPTWGLHVGYNPWSGWNFGVSWSNGFFSVGASWGGGWGHHYRPGRCCGGWYGGGFRRSPVIINTGNINIGNTVNVGNRTNIGNQMNRNQVNKRTLNNNIYKKPENRARNASPTMAHRNLKQARPTQGRQNNVYAGKNGEIARHTNDGHWETRQDGQWQKDASLDRPVSDMQQPPARETREQQLPQQTRDMATQTTSQQRQQAANTARNHNDWSNNANRQGQHSNNRQQDFNRSHHARQAGARREGGGGHRGGGGGRHR